MQIFYLKEQNFAIAVHGGYIYIRIFAVMTKKLLFSIILLMTATAFCHGAKGSDRGFESEDKKLISGFSGGMMIHSGYISGCDNPYGYTPSGATFGIGGVVKIHTGRHLRAGFEGYFSKLPVMGNGSFSQVFWTGALCDWYWKKGKFYPYAGLTLGGGSKTSWYMFNGDSSDWLPETRAVFHKEPFFAADPFVGTEFAVGKALRLTLKADWLLAINGNGINRPTGPRIYFGFIFAH